LVVRFALRFTSPEAAEAAAAALRSEGFAVDIEWSVSATSAMASKEDVERTRSRMQALAEELDGLFLGNGSFGRSHRPTD
jgi:DNA-binding IclR family transcriptional regulator